MGIKIDHSEIEDKIENGKLVLYFPHSVDLDKSEKSISMLEWINCWGFRVDKRKDKTIILYPHSFNLNQCFYDRTNFDYFQSLNKDVKNPMYEEDLLSLIFSKSFFSMGLYEKNASVIEGVSEDSSSIISKMRSYKSFCKNFYYNIDKTFYKEDFLVDKEIEKKLKKDKKEYLYNDFHIINSLSSRILLLKNNYSKEDFEYLAKMFYRKKSIELVNFGNAEFLGVKSKNPQIKYNEIFSHLENMFEDFNLCYNIISSILFSYKIRHDKTIDLSNKEDLEKTPGYIFSKTYLKLKEEAIYFENKEDFSSNVLQYNFIKSRWYFDPFYLLESLVLHCKKMNEIMSNKDLDLSKDENVRVFLGGMLEDLVLGMKKLGMFLPTKSIK